MSWKKNRTITDFLRNAEALGEKYNAIQLNNSIKSLTLPFWPIKEIEESDDMKDDWEVNKNYIPFYGNWHDLFCIDISSSTLSIIYINDDRDIIHKWEDIDSFLNALRHIPEGGYRDTSGIIDEESYLDF